MTSSAAIFGAYFVLLLVFTVGAQGVPDEVNEGTEGSLPTLNITDFGQSGHHDASSSLNTTTEERPSKCKEILQ